MDAVPRITRAQRMDALSAMANIAGYRAVIEAAVALRALLPRSGDGGRAGEAGAGVHRRRGRRRAGGDRGGPGAGRAGARLRHAPRGARAGGEPGRHLRRVQVRRGGRGGGRLRQGDERGLSGGRAGDDRAAHQAVGHRHLDGAHPRQAGAAAHHLGRGRLHGARVGRRRHGGRAGGELRAHRARQGGREVRRHHHRPHRPAEPDGAPVERALRDDGVQPPQGGRARREGRAQAGGRGPARRPGAQGRRADVAAAEAAAAARGRSDRGAQGRSTPRRRTRPRPR